MKEAKLAAVNYVGTRLKKKLVNLVDEVQQQTMTNEQITEKVNQDICQYYQRTEGYIKSVVDPAVRELTGKVDEALNSANEDLQEK